jgi:hypothetical protein
LNFIRNNFIFKITLRHEVLFVDEDGNPIEAGHENVLYVDESGNEIPEEIAQQLLETGKYFDSRDVYMERPTVTQQSNAATGDGLSQQQVSASLPASAYGSLSKSTGAAQAQLIDKQAEKLRKATSQQQIEPGAPASVAAGASDYESLSYNKSASNADMQKSLSSRRLIQPPPKKSESKSTFSNLGYSSGSVNAASYQQQQIQNSASGGRYADSRSDGDSYIRVYPDSLVSQHPNIQQILQRDTGSLASRNASVRSSNQSAYLSKRQYYQQHPQSYVEDLSLLGEDELKRRQQEIIDREVQRAQSQQKQPINQQDNQEYEEYEDEEVEELPQVQQQQQRQQPIEAFRFETEIEYENENGSRVVKKIQPEQNEQDQQYVQDQYYPEEQQYTQDQQYQDQQQYEQDQQYVQDQYYPEEQQYTQDQQYQDEQQYTQQQQYSGESRLVLEKEYPGERHYILEQPYQEQPEQYVLEQQHDMFSLNSRQSSARKSQVSQSNQSYGVVSASGPSSYARPQSSTSRKSQVSQSNQSYGSSSYTQQQEVVKAASPAKSLVSAPPASQYDLSKLENQFNVMKVRYVGELTGSNIIYNLNQLTEEDINKLYDLVPADERNNKQPLAVDNDDDQYEDGLIDPADPNLFKDEIVDIDFGAIDAYTSALNAQINNAESFSSSGGINNQNLQFSSHVLTSNHATFLDNQLLLSEPYYGSASDEKQDGFKANTQLLVSLKEFENNQKQQKNKVEADETSQQDDSNSNNNVEASSPSVLSQQQQAYTVGDLSQFENFNTLNSSNKNYETMDRYKQSQSANSGVYYLNSQNQKENVHIR